MSTFLNKTLYSPSRATPHLNFMHHPCLLPSPWNFHFPLQSSDQGGCRALRYQHNSKIAGSQSLFPNQVPWWIIPLLAPQGADFFDRFCLKCLFWSDVIHLLGIIGQRYKLFWKYKFLYRQDWELFLWLQFRAHEPTESSEPAVLLQQTVALFSFRGSWIS